MQDLPLFPIHYILHEKTGLCHCQYCQSVGFNSVIYLIILNIKKKNLLLSNKVLFSKATTNSTAKFLDSHQVASAKGDRSQLKLLVAFFDALFISKLYLNM